VTTGTDTVITEGLSSTTRGDLLAGTAAVGAARRWWLVVVTGDSFPL